MQKCLIGTKLPQASCTIQSKATHPVELPRPVRQAVAITSAYPDTYFTPKMGSMVPMKAMGVALSIRPAGDTKEETAACVNSNISKLLKFCVLECTGQHYYLIN